MFSQLWQHHLWKTAIHVTRNWLLCPHQQQLSNWKAGWLMLDNSVRRQNYMSKPGRTCLWLNLPVWQHRANTYLMIYSSYASCCSPGDWKNKRQFLPVSISVKNIRNALSVLAFAGTASPSSPCLNIPEKRHKIWKLLKATDEKDRTGMRRRATKRQER